MFTAGRLAWVWQVHLQDDRAAGGAAVDGDLVADPACHVQAHPEPGGSGRGGGLWRPVPAVADFGLGGGPGGLQGQPGHR